LSGGKMVLKNFKWLMNFIAVIVVVVFAYGLLTMKEKRGPIENTGAIHKLYPTTDTDGLRP
jgi:hypothetical protein